MKHSARLALLTGALLQLMSTTAHAEGGDMYKIYVRGAGGLNKTQGMEYDINAGEIRNEFDKGYTGSVAAGADFGDYTLELEYAHRTNSIDTQTLGGAKLPDSDGTATSNAVMLNGYYETPTDSPLIPYIGFGLGFADVQLNDNKSGATLLVDDGTKEFAYQAMGGLAYNVTDSLTLFTEYRYFATGTVEITTATNTTHKVAYENHNLLAGLKYSFK